MHIILCLHVVTPVPKYFPYYSHTSSMQKIVDLAFYISIVTMAKAFEYSVPVE